MVPIGLCGSLYGSYRALRVSIGFKEGDCGSGGPYMVPIGL